MAFQDRLIETFENVTGRTLVEPERLDALEETFQQFAAFRDDAEDLALNVMDYVGGRPQEVQATERRRLAQRSRIAFIHDPLAGAEANLLANFAFGRGVPKPQAKNEEVQKVIDEAWDDPINRRKLTSFEAQRYRSNELLTTANIYPVWFERNGTGRIGFLNGDLVTDVVTDAEDDERPMWYVARKLRVRWDFDNHIPEPAPVTEFKEGRERVWYYRHWEAEDAEPEESPPKANWGEPQSLGWGEKPPRRNAPKPEDVADGVVEHFRINRVGRTQFGIPPWTRSLRFFSAMNQLVEAQVAMAQGRASIVAKRMRRGGPKDILKAASAVQSQAGELATSRFGARTEPANTGPGTNPTRGQAPVPAGSFWLENEGEKLEAVRLSSGGAEAVNDAQLIRSPISAVSGFGQHYLGDASTTNLATASTLELPTHMTVSAWQETFEGLFRWFIDRVLESAIRSGRLGGLVPEDAEEHWKPLNELRLAEDQEEMEARTGKELDYSFEMPYPGRRNLPDVTTATTGIGNAFDAQGENTALRSLLLDYQLRHGFQLEDPAEEVEKIMREEEKLKREREKAAREFLQNPPPPPGPMPDGTAPDGRDGAERSQYGERRRGTPPEDVTETLLDPLYVESILRRTEDDFDELMGDAAALITGRAPSGSNGASAPTLPR